MKKVIAACVALSISTAAYAAIHSAQQRNSVLELCRVVNTDADVQQLEGLMRGSNLSEDNKAYVYDMCFAYQQGKIDVTNSLRNLK